VSDLTVLHTNDLHGKLSERAGEIIAREKLSADNCLLLDAGDAVPSGNIYYRPGGDAILARMSDLGYDAMAIGNREFHFLEVGLRSKVKLARFPVLCANLRGRGQSDFDVPSVDDGAPTNVRASIDLDKSGLRVAVFGLTVPMITRKMLAGKVSPFWFEDPIEAAARIVPELRSRADLLIALTHIGMQSDIELANALPDIDLIVGGHTHALMEKPRMVGRTAIVQAGWWGHCLGRIEVTMTTSGPSLSGRLIDLQ
jgi:2',3'-cyclic-nucleotide 2'-phosphodiesterase (5'-nucleotidase family)